MKASFPFLFFKGKKGAAKKLWYMENGRFFFVPGGDSDNESLQQYYLHTDTQQLIFSFFTITTLAKMHINQNRFQVKLV